MNPQRDSLLPLNCSEPGDSEGLVLKGWIFLADGWLRQMDRGKTCSFLLLTINSNKKGTETIYPKR
jgi:hypothetical protein